MAGATTIPKLVLTVAALFLGAAAVVVLIAGLGDTNALMLAAGVVLVLVAAGAGLGASTRR